MTSSQWESKIQGSWKLGEDFFKKQIAIYKQRAYILALEFNDQVGYMKMKKRLGFSCK